MLVKEFYEKVAKIQKELKAPKSQFNSFGKYNYRNQEDILEAVKPLLGDLVLTITDEVVQVGERIYLKATTVLTDGTHTLSTSAMAREEEDKKGMDSAQLSGSCSSYARKYALNGLFLIDDTKDADASNTHGKTPTDTSKFKKKDVPEVEAPKEGTTGKGKFSLRK